MIPIIPSQDAEAAARPVQRDIQHYMRPGTLQLASLPPLSLYVHLPWCLKKCPYCDFNSHEMGGRARCPSSATSMPCGRPGSGAAADLGASGAKHLHWRRHAQPVFARSRSTGCSATFAPACRWQPAARSRWRPTPARSRKTVSGPSARRASRACRSACRASTTRTCKPWAVCTTVPRPWQRWRKPPRRLIPSTWTSCTPCPVRIWPGWSKTCAPRWHWRRRTCRSTT